TKSAYDFANHVIQTVAPNGSFTFISYNTGGQKISAYTGGSATISTQAASIQNASVGNGSGAPLGVTWDQSGCAGVTSWVAWDTSAHGGSTAPSTQPGMAGTYAHATSAAGNGNGLTASIPVSTGQTIYFRVVTRDAAGNLIWTEERSVVVPPRIA